MSDENCLSEARKLETTNSVPKQRIGTAFSISNLNSILTRLGLEKQEIVKAMGFGMLLKLLPQTKFPRQLAFWVQRRMDHRTGQIEFSKGRKLIVNEYDVELVLGIPRKTRPINCSL